MGTFILKRKTYAAITNYDRYNSLRNMNDSDILAEQKKVNPVGIQQVGTATGIGAGIGTVVGVGRALFGKNKGGAMRTIKNSAMLGAGVGGAVGLGQRADKQKEIDEYNSRLEMAQRGAKRRERLDWNRNLMAKTNYTY